MSSARPLDGSRGQFCYPAAVVFCTLSPGSCRMSEPQKETKASYGNNDSLFYLHFHDDLTGAQLASLVRGVRNCSCVQG
jgi:hypothetical protein